MKTLWGETVHSHRRKKRNIAIRTSKIPYSITGNGMDCQVIGHTEGHRDLAGCTVCLDCGVKIFCPQCVSQHPTDPNAIPVLCSLHEERKQAYVK